MHVLDCLAVGIPILVVQKSTNYRRLSAFGRTKNNEPEARQINNLFFLHSINGQSEQENISKIFVQLTGIENPPD